MSQNTKLISRLNQTSEIMEDQKYVLSLCKADGVPMDLDLADKRQYNFLINLRGGAEYLKAYFPHNYQLLENSRKRVMEEKKSKALKRPRRLTLLEKIAAGDDVSGWHDNIQIIGFVAQGQGNNKNRANAQYNLAVTGLVGFVEGLEEMNATLQIYNTNTGQIIATNSMENLLDSGYDTIITASGMTSDLDGVEAFLQVDYLPYNQATKESKIVKIELKDMVDPTSPIQVDDPVHKAARPNEGFIKVCLGRWDSDCDYEYAAQPAPHPPLPYIAVKGNVSFPGPITDPCAGATTFGALFFLKRRAGGSTQLFADYGQMCKYFQVSGSNISWNFAPAAFEKAQWNQGDEIDLNLTVQISVNGKPKNGQFQVTSLKGVPASVSVAKIDVLRFVWGCLGADSMVVMKDNSKKRIDSIHPGEMVQIDEKGNCLRVLDIVTGKEEKPCLRIKTNKYSVLVTDEHPIARKEDDFCLAKELKVGDIINTLSGPETIKSIADEQYDGIVYNLKLEGEQTLGVPHYANGIMVGDGNMQRVVLEKRKEKSRKQRKISPLWRFDAANAARLKKREALIPVK